MPEEKSPLRLRQAKSVPLTLKLEEDGGATFTKNFRISFDFNAISLIEEMTRSPFRPDGLGFLSGEIWKKLNATNISIMFFASVLANHPEYNTLDKATGEPTTDGLGALRSYLDPGNVETIIKALNEAFMIALPKEKREEIERQQREEEEARRKAAGEGDRPTIAEGPAGSSAPAVVAMAKPMPKVAEPDLPGSPG